MASKSGSIVKKSIQIDVTNGTKSVKALKEEIKDLRDALLNLEEGTEEYDETQKRLTEDVDDLNRVMNAHKTDAKELEGSYNSLQNKLKELRQAWKATNDEAERDVLGKKILEINNQLKTMDASIGDFRRNVGNYESAWEGLSKVMEQDEKIADDLAKGITAFGRALGLSESQVKGITDALRKLKDAFKIAKDITKMTEATNKLSAAEKAAAIQGNTLAASQTATGVAAKGMATAENTATVATKGLSVAMRGLSAAFAATGIAAIVIGFSQLSSVLGDLGIFGKGAREEINELSDDAIEASEKAATSGNKLLGIISGLAGALGIGSLVTGITGKWFKVRAEGGELIGTLSDKELAKKITHTVFDSRDRKIYKDVLEHIDEWRKELDAFKDANKAKSLSNLANSTRLLQEGLVAGTYATSDLIGWGITKDELKTLPLIQKANKDLVKIQNDRVRLLDEEKKKQLENLDFELRLAKARDADEGELLQLELERVQAMRDAAEERKSVMQQDMQTTRTAYEQYKEMTDYLEEDAINIFDGFFTLKNKDVQAINAITQFGVNPAGIRGLKGQKALVESTETLRQSVDAQNSAITAANDLIGEYDAQILKLKQDIQVYDETQKNATGGTAELKKWADTIKDPKFQEEWRKIIEADYGDLNPVDKLKEQYISAIELLNKWKTETQEVDTFFQQAISDAHNVWGTIIGKESEMFEESKTPLMKLEEEFDEWLELYKRWGADTLALTQYYEKKIAEERERIAQEELDAFVQKIDERLETEERLADLFKPVSGNKTVEEDMNNLTALYNTQMNYLNGLLEAADITEEAYAAIEDRILSLTITFGKEMEKLKEEQDDQNKRFGWMTQKWVANWQFMEDAAASFSDAFTDLGLENSIAFKAFATAQALISTYLAANRVMAETAGGLWARIAAAAAITTAGLANVYSIWSVNADGSNSSSFSSSVSMNATPAIIDSTPIQTVTTPQYTNTEDELNRPIFVTVTDIQEGLDHKVTVTDETSF